MNFLTKSIITLFARIITFICSFLILVITAQLLGTEGRGVFALVILFVTIAKMVGSLGIDVSNVFYAAKNRLSINALVSNSKLFSITFGISLIVIFLLISYFYDFSKLLNIPFYLLLFSIITLPFFLYSTYITGLLLGKNRILEYNLIFVSQPVLLALIFFAGIFLNIFTIQFAIYSWTISIIVVGIGSLFFFKDFSIKRPTYHIEAGKKSITFGLKSYFANLIQYLNLRFDYFLVNYFLSIKMVGIYSVSVAMAEILFHVPNAIGTILFSRVSNYSSEKANQDTPMICRNVLAFTVFSAIILTIIANYIFPVLFTDKYADSINPFIILLPGTLFLTISKILVNDITGRGKPIVNMYIAILTFILNIVLNIILIPEYGILGAALASSITYSLSTFVLIFIFLKISEVSISELFIIKKTDFKYYFKFFNTYLKGKKDQ